VGIGTVSDSYNLSIRTPTATNGSYSTLAIFKHTNSSAEGRSRIILGGDFGNSFMISQNGYTNQSAGVSVPEHAAFFEIFNQNGIFIGTNSATTLYAQFSNTNDKRFSIYSTLNASLTNYERLSFKPQSGGAFLIMSEALGTGVYRDIEIQNGGSTKMTVTSAGNVGIGTTTPAYKLAVDGGVYITAGNGLNIDTSSSGIKTITASGNDVIVGGAHTVSTFGLWARGTRSTGIDATGAGGDLLLTTAGVEKVRVTTAGNVGIGTTAPNERLTVVGNISAVGDIAVATSLQGVILVAPNSTRWKITINDDGSLQTTAL